MAFAVGRSGSVAPVKAYATMLDSMTVSPIAQYPPASFHGESSRRKSSFVRPGLPQPQTPPLRTSTYPPHTANVDLKKRIIVCCDG